MQPDCRARDERTPQRVVARRKVEGSSAEVGSRARISRADGLRCLQQSARRYLVAWLCARRELHGHLDGQRAAGE